MKNFPTKLLKEWFLQERRPFPWRESINPYRVWVSEMMLQQTQSSVVVPYFERWMKTFPTIADLASASYEQVVKCWEGLGYYARVRNLHSAARSIVKEYGGELPSDPLKLSKIKGIGPYTQGAILSFAFHQKAVAVDGNVLRVLSRFFGFQEEIDLPKAKKKLEQCAEQVLPDHEPWIFNEALIELGATVCMKKAKCSSCPIKSGCFAFVNHLQDKLPLRKARPKTIHLKREVAVVRCEGEFLLQKQKKGEIMEDLYEFPYLDKSTGEIKTRFEEVLGCSLKYVRDLPEQKHSFTRYQVKLFPHLLEAHEKAGTHLWKKREELSQLPFSSGHRRILNHLLGQ